jgi:hypothetical protein
MSKIAATILLLAALLCPCALAAETEILFEQFARQIKAARADPDGDGDERVSAAIEALRTKLTAGDLPKLEAFVATGDNSLKWAVIPIFVEFKQLDPIPRLLTPVLAKETSAEKRRYRLWKVWEHLFGERKDRRELSAQLGLAFPRHYANADAEGRQVIADLFEQKVGTPAEFQAFIERSLQKK